MQTTIDSPIGRIELRAGHSLFSGVNDASLIKGFLDNRSEVKEDQEQAEQQSTERAVEVKFTNKFR